MEREKQLSLLRLQTTLYHSSFYASHTFGLGLRTTNQTTQYDGLVTSHCITLGELDGQGHHLIDPKLRPGGKSEDKTTSTHES